MTSEERKAVRDAIMALGLERDPWTRPAVSVPVSCG